MWVTLGFQQKDTALHYTLKYTMNQHKLTNFKSSINQFLNIEWVVFIRGYFLFEITSTSFG